MEVLSRRCEGVVGVGEGDKKEERLVARCELLESVARLLGDEGRGMQCSRRGRLIDVVPARILRECPLASSLSHWVEAALPSPPDVIARHSIPVAAHQSDVIESVVVGGHRDVAVSMAVEVLPRDESLAEPIRDGCVPQGRHVRADLIELVVLVLVPHRLEVQLPDGGGSPAFSPEHARESVAVRI